MSITKTSGVEGVVSSFLEAAIFFLFITPVYWLATSVLYILIAAITASAKWDLLRYPADWVASLPVWVWILQAGGFLLLITIYWTPRDKRINDAQVRGLVMFLLTAALIGILYVQITSKGITGTASLFNRIFIKPLAAWITG